ncbi:hypothetical protein GX51_04233 [Blastomyces parvus]|uniref:Uncharacterized protein n=1 Tax=Blastomyces parvus TaxID=2060905 RepID=A0A2B7X3D9_9EURO|nr:hypothetical protein GX51_04233 [Blastomyces parvus]
MEPTSTNSTLPELSLAFHPLSIGDPGDVPPSPEQLVSIISLLQQADICCCFVQEYGLNYYGAKRVTHDRTLCIPDSQHQKAVEIFTSHSEILKPCGPLPLVHQNSLHHKYPRFKAIGRLDFWLLLPASYCHISCEPDNIEWSQGNLPYPKLPVFVQSLLDTKQYVDLCDLIDGQDLSEEWGIEHLDLSGTTDTKWLEWLIPGMRDDGVEDIYIFIDANPISRLDAWKKYTTTKQKRMGWKYPPEIYATRFRKFGSKDPRTRNRPGL